MFDNLDLTKCPNCGAKEGNCNCFYEVVNYNKINPFYIISENKEEERWNIINDVTGEPLKYYNMFGALEEELLFIEDFPTEYEVMEHLENKYKNKTFII